MNLKNQWSLRDLSQEHLGFLREEFSYVEAPEEDLQNQTRLPSVETVTFVGPTRVRVELEAYPDSINVAIYPLIEERDLQSAPPTALDIYWIVRARAPGQELIYRTLAQAGRAKVGTFLMHAGQDLRILANDALRGDISPLVHDVRMALRAAMPRQGTPGVDWWLEGET